MRWRWTSSAQGTNRESVAPTFSQCQYIAEDPLVYLTLFGWSFLAATVVPVGSEPALIFFLHQGHSAPWLVFTATIGNYLGACTTYALARGLVARWRPAADAEKAGGRAWRLVTRYGGVALVFSWVPIIGDALVAAAGAARIHFGWFSFWTFVGKAARYAGLAFAFGSRSA